MPWTWYPDAWNDVADRLFNSIGHPERWKTFHPKPGALQSVP